MNKRFLALLLALALTLAQPVSALAEGGGTETGLEPQTAEESLPPEETEGPAGPEESPAEPEPSDLPEEPENDYAPVEEPMEEAEGEGEILMAAATLSGPCGAEGDNVTWALTEDGILTISGTGAMRDFNFPRDGTIQGNDVPWYEFNSQIKKIVIGEGVTTVGAYAFYLNGMVEEVTVPDSLTRVGDSAFSNCSALREFRLPEGLTQIGSSAFYKCENLRGVKLPASLTSLSSFAFSGCKCLTEIELPAGLAVLGEHAFGDTGISAIEVAPENPAYMEKDGVLFNKTGTTLLCYPPAKPGAAYVIPDEVSRIGDYAFFNCRELTELRFPAGLTEIGEAAFYFCTGLGRLDLPEGLTRIADYAFYGCEGVAEMNLPSTVTSIGGDAFSGCITLRVVTIPASVEVLGMGAFNLVDLMEDIFILSPSCVIEEYAVPPAATIHGYPGSTAEKYAAANGNPFVPIEGPSPAPVPEITAEAQSGEGAPAVTFQMEAAALADAVLTAEEKEKLAASGGRLELLLTVEDADGTVTAAEKRAAEAAAGKYRIGQYLDIELFKTLNGAAEAVHETGAPLRVTVQIPEALLGTAYRSFALLRIHEGKAELLPDLDRDPKTLTVETDRFSSYAISYLSKVYTVRFDPNGGKSDTESLLTREDGRLPSLPKAAREKLPFSGWYTAREGGAKVTADTVFDGDTVVYARWSTAPATGDTADPALWAELMAASLTAALVLLRKEKRAKENAKQTV